MEFDGRMAWKGKASWRGDLRGGGGYVPKDWRGGGVGDRGLGRQQFRVEKFKRNDAEAVERNACQSNDEEHAKLVGSFREIQFNDSSSTVQSITQEDDSTTRLET